MTLNCKSSESVMMQGLMLDMEEAWLQTLAQVKAFSDGTAEVAFRVPTVERASINPTESAQGSVTQIHGPSFGPISEWRILSARGRSDNTTISWHHLSSNCFMSHRDFT